MIELNLTRTMAAPAKKVWAVIGDFARSPGPAVAIEVEEEGDPERNGVGMIRTITIGRNCVRERLESIDPPYSFSYSLLSGAPIKDYLGTANVIDQGESTMLDWNVTFRSKLPGLGWLIGIIVKKTIHRFLDEVEAGMH